MACSKRTEKLRIASPPRTLDLPVYSTPDRSTFVDPWQVREKQALDRLFEVIESVKSVELKDLEELRDFAVRHVRDGFHPSEIPDCTFTVRSYRNCVVLNLHPHSRTSEKCLIGAIAIPNRWKKSRITPEPIHLGAARFLVKASPAR
jgi:hypothetical protein